MPRWDFDYSRTLYIFHALPQLIILLLLKENNFTRAVLEGLQIASLQNSIISYNYGDNVKCQINLLKLSQDVIALRDNVINLILDILNNQEPIIRSYYNLIKESGGFKKLELPRRPKYEAVDLSLENELMTQEKLFFIQERSRKATEKNSQSKENKGGSESHLLQFSDECKSTIDEQKLDNLNSDDMFVIAIPGTDENVMFL